MRVEYVDHMGTDLSVVNAARVSHKKRSDWDRVWDESDSLGRYQVRTLKPKDDRLLKYLAQNKHFSPFNHTFLTFHVKASIATARQLVKHEYMPWNEVSGRYVVFEKDYDTPIFREKAEDVKQGSGPQFEHEAQMALRAQFDKAMDSSFDNYKGLLANGVCEEQARLVLPLVANTEWYWSGTLGAFAKMVKLRTGPTVQGETRQVADLISEEIYEHFPVSWGYLMEADLV